jgi:hypothetical protein
MKKIILMLFLSFTLAGCLPSAFQKGEREVGPQEEFLKGQVAPGFPTLPRYPEAQVVESVSYGESRGAAFVTKDNVDQVLTFFTDSLTQLGWEFQLLKNSETNYEYKVKNVKYEGSIIINIAADGKTTAMTYSTSPR